MKKKKAIFCWSGGKDSAFALYKAMNNREYEVVCLLTTVHKVHQRVSMHGVRVDKIKQQAEAIGLPLHIVYVSEGTNSEYEREMATVLGECKNQGIYTVLFGDIFLEDLRAYREKNISEIGMNAEFPLWGRDTSTLVMEFLDLGFKTQICCVNDGYLDSSYVGKTLSKKLIAGMPDGVDVCGENGEYHSFCFDGPLFKHAVSCEMAEIVYKPLRPEELQDDYIKPSATKGFWFCEIL